MGTGSIPTKPALHDYALIVIFFLFFFQFFYILHQTRATSNGRGIQGVLACHSLLLLFFFFCANTFFKRSSDSGNVPLQFPCRSVGNEFSCFQKKKRKKESSRMNYTARHASHTFAARIAADTLRCNTLRSCGISNLRRQSNEL